MTGISSIKGKLKINFKIGKVSVEWDFVVVDFPQSTFSVLLGSDFFRSCAATIDYESEALRFRANDGASHVILGISN